MRRLLRNETQPYGDIWESFAIVVRVLSREADKCTSSGLPLVLCPDRFL